MDLGSVDAECTMCEAKIKIKIADIAAQRTVRCPNGHTIKLNDVGGGFGRLKRAADRI